MMSAEEKKVYLEALLESWEDAWRRRMWAEGQEPGSFEDQKKAVIEAWFARGDDLFGGDDDFVVALKDL